MDLLSLPLEGGCQCGRQRYRITEMPLTLYACHCGECQRQSAGAFGLSMPVPRDALDADLEGPGRWERRAASGRIVVARFCSVCGTRLFHEPARNPAIVNVKPGTLDDTSWIEPVGHLWLNSAQPWFQPPEDALAYPGQPADFEALFQRFRERYRSAGTER